MLTSRRPHLGALLVGAAMGMMAFAPSMPAIAMEATLRSERRFDIQRGNGLRSLQRLGHRSKPWTCTAIEQRRAAKRRNVKRGRARRRA